ncbi:MAG TPA: hypothetical protein VGC95_07510, partial [Chitinophagaceae bacterium]
EEGTLNTSQGSLQSITTGDCLGSIVGGTYKQDTLLNTSNYVDVQVQVTKTGTYVVSTDTINGFFFKATGNFQTIGLDTVRLQANGTPQSSGSNIFTVSYDSTQCTFTVPVLSGSGGTAVFSLAGDPGTCSGASVQGILTTGVAATSANTATIEVNVTTPGTYAISTTAVNGVTYSASGNFSAAGPQSVTLSASGTPAAAGTFDIPVTAGSSNCSFQIIAVAGTPANYTLNGAPNTCTGATVQGVYSFNTPLNTSNTATIQVNVAAVGTYSITTTAVNGITFTGSGIYSATGLQSVVLTGSGTPTVAGDNVISITAGGSSCTFIVTVSPPQTNPDLFPLSANSWWSYDDPNQLFVTGDSLTRVNVNTGTILGNDYQIFQNQNNTTPLDSSYFRKNGSDYFELTAADFYSSVFFDALVPADINFLKEGLTLNQTWNSAEFDGTVSGVATKIQYSFTCIEANTTASVNGTTFTNVYKVSWRPNVSTNGGAYQPDPVVSYESWYAQGIGLIYLKLDNNGAISELNIRHWLVF